jgi:pilus assembly protein CpaE
MPADDQLIRVLIVDDISETRDSIKRMLQFDPHIEVVGIGQNGQEAIDKSIELKPEVILMDINMPDMDGIAATRSIRKSHPYAQVIMISVQNDPDYMRRAMRVGAHDFLSKPPMLDELTATIHRAGKEAFERKAQLERETAQIIKGVGTQVTDSTGPLGNIVIVYSPKGGVGCTTIATNLAFVLQNGNNKVAIVDASMQYGDVPIFLSLKAKNNILDLVTRIDELDPELVEDIMTKHAASNLHILAAPPRPELADQINGNQFGKLLKYLADLYDYIIVDTASYLNDITLSAFECADFVLLMTTQEIPSIKNSNAFLTLLDALDFPREKIIFSINRFEKRIGISSERVGESLRQPVTVVIPLDDRNSVNDSIKRGVPLMLETKTHPVCKSIINLSELLVESLDTVAKTAELS